MHSAGKQGKGGYRYEHVVPPKEVDWRTRDVVGPIKNQHVGGSPCGCCWAFATIGVTECIVAMATGKPISLSEQQLIDCDKAGARLQAALFLILLSLLNILQGPGASLWGMRQGRCALAGPPCVLSFCSLCVSRHCHGVCHEMRAYRRRRNCRAGELMLTAGCRLQG